MGKLGKICSPSNFKKAYLYLQKNGFCNTWYAALERIHDKNNECYIYEAFTEADIAEQKRQAEKLSEELSVCFDVLVPAFETKPGYLRELLLSLKEQTYPAWRLVIADASEGVTVEETVQEFRHSFPQLAEKLCYCRLGENKGISGNSNEVLPKLRAQYTGLLDHDDTLTPDALYETARAIRAWREAHGGQDGPPLLYSDEDKMDEGGRHFYEPHFKTEYNYDLILSNNYICHFLVMRTQIMQELQFRPLYDGAQDYDLALRCVEYVRREQGRAAGADANGHRFGVGEEGQIVHVPKVLYHWRCHAGSTADNPASKMYAYEAGRKAVFDHCSRMGFKVFLKHEKHLGFYRVEYEKDIFAVRGDIGAVGGRILAGNRLAGGAYGADGQPLYAGLHRRYSGYMHRAVLKQDVAAVDLRCMRLRAELKPLLQEAVSEILGAEHPFTAAVGRAEPDRVAQTAAAAFQTRLLSGEQLRQISLLAGAKIREAGYRILWNPTVEITLS